MREIIPGLVWIGNARDARDVTSVLKLGIVAVVDLAIEEIPCQFPREITYCRFPLLDGEENSPALLRTATHTVAMLIEMQLPLLIACSGGMSRSPAIVAIALSRTTNESSSEWLKGIASSGPCDVAPALWHDLQACDAEQNRTQ